MKSKKLIRNVLVTVAIVLMSTVLCGAGCTNVADSGSNGGSSGSSNGVDAELKAIPQVGSIIMKDGSLKTAANITGADKANAIAVVYKVDAANKKAYAVGKVCHKSDLVWTELSTTGFGRIIANLVTNVSGSAGSLTFDGYKDGSIGLEELKKEVSDYGDGTNYPAWSWCEKYGTTNCSSTSFEAGWYFPSIAELFDIWKEKTSVEASLTAAVDWRNNFRNANYWSSSQSASRGDLAPLLDFRNGSCSYESKHEENSVCAVRAFTY